MLDAAGKMIWPSKKAEKSRPKSVLSRQVALLALLSFRFCPYRGKR